MSSTVSTSMAAGNDPGEISVTSPSITTTSAAKSSFPTPTQISAKLKSNPLKSMASLTINETNGSSSQTKSKTKQPIVSKLIPKKSTGPTNGNGTTPRTRPTAGSNQHRPIHQSSSTSSTASATAKVSPRNRTSRPFATTSATSEPPAPPKPLRRMKIGSVIIDLMQMDIVLAEVDAIVNAANSLSFTPMDNGISGALRRACAPETVTGMKKQWWDEKGVEHHDIKLPSLQAGVQPTAGGLKDRGVKHIIHSVGPIWTDWKIAESTFNIVLPKIQTVVRRALNVAERIGATSVALPAISGGIFTHYKEGTDIKDREMRAARRAVLQATFAWAVERMDSETASEAETSTVDSNSVSSTSSSTVDHASSSSSSPPLTHILICDLHPRQKGGMHYFVQEWDKFDHQPNRVKVVGVNESEMNMQI